MAGTLLRLPPAACKQWADALGALPPGQLQHVAKDPGGCRVLEAYLEVCCVAWGWGAVGRRLQGGAGTKASQPGPCEGSKADGASQGGLLQAAQFLSWHANRIDSSERCYPKRGLRRRGKLRGGGLPRCRPPAALLRIGTLSSYPLHPPAT